MRQAPRYHSGHGRASVQAGRCTCAWNDDVDVDDEVDSSV